MIRTSDLARLQARPRPRNREMQLVKPIEDEYKGFSVQVSGVGTDHL
jgi:hypothetical protein